MYPEGHNMNIVFGVVWMLNIKHLVGECQCVPSLFLVISKVKNLLLFFLWNSLTHKHNQQFIIPKPIYQ